MSAWEGVVVGLLVVAAGALAVVPVLRGRRRANRLPGSFPCLLRPPGSRRHGVWPRRVCRGQWVHDVLVVRHGLSRRAVLPLAVRFPEGDLTPAPAGASPWGPTALALDLRLDDGTVVTLLAPGEYREVVAGPYLVVAVSP